MQQTTSLKEVNGLIIYDYMFTDKILTGAQINCSVSLKNKNTSSYLFSFCESVMLCVDNCFILYPEKSSSFDTLSPSSQLNSSENMMYIWKCHKGIPLCRSVSHDRCPGQWVTESSLSLILEAVKTIKDEELDNQSEQPYSYPYSENYNSETSLGRLVCAQPSRKNISLDQCKEECLRNRYCTIINYRPSSTAASGKTHPSACLLVDFDSQFPQYER